MYPQTRPTWQWPPEWARRAWPIDNIPATPAIPAILPPGLAVARATNQIDDNDVAGKITPETITNGPRMVKMAEMAGTLTRSKTVEKCFKTVKICSGYLQKHLLIVQFPRLKVFNGHKRLLFSQCCIMFVNFARKTAYSFGLSCPTLLSFA